MRNDIPRRRVNIWILFSARNRARFKFQQMKTFRSGLFMLIFDLCELQIFGFRSNKQPVGGTDERDWSMCLRGDIVWKMHFHARSFPAVSIKAVCIYTFHIKYYCCEFSCKYTDENFHVLVPEFSQGVSEANVFWVIFIW